TGTALPGERAPARAAAPGGRAAARSRRTRYLLRRSEAMTSPDRLLRVGQEVGLEDLAFGVRLTAPAPDRPRYVVAAVEAECVRVSGGERGGAPRIPASLIRGGPAQEERSAEAAA